MTNTLKFEKALLADGWAEAVEIEIDNAGLISDIKTNAEPSKEFLSGCAIPGMANLHSHAHQRAMAGLAEQAGASDDSFWTWRDTMYRFIEAIQPQHLHAIAAQLYLEMLQGGYTHVGEFHYLHHQVGGVHYDNPAEMSEQLIDAAQSVGLGMTMLPVLYQQGGFAGVELGKHQRRFQHDVDSYLKLIDQLSSSQTSNSNYTTGIAAHSLRAVSIESLSEVLAALGAQSQMPVHIHIAEQQQEVSDCIAYSGARPVQYLLDNFAVDQRWCLIHATHMDESETRRLATSGAVAGLCPTTEANLGDGFFNATSFLAQHGNIGIGSDSHISVSVSEELRWLEYGQRLLHNSRNQLADRKLRSSGRTLLQLACAGGAQACGQAIAKIAVGQRADLVVLDTTHPLLCERHQDEILDSWIFSGNQNTISDVFVAGSHLIKQGRHAQQAKINANFRTAMQQLRATA